MTPSRQVLTIPLAKAAFPAVLEFYVTDLLVSDPPFWGSLKIVETTSTRTQKTEKVNSVTQYFLEEIQPNSTIIS